MEIISLAATPQQAFGFKAGGNDYELTIRDISEQGQVPEMAYDLKINDTSVADGFLVLAGEMLIPYKYQEANGNLIIFTQPDEQADFRKFGDSQNLYFLTQEEADFYRGN